MSEKIREKEMAILRILKTQQGPQSSSRITRELEATGYDMPERTVRFYLQKLDEEGLTSRVGKRGRVITGRGIKELDSSRIMERVGFLSAKIDQMTYGMNFDLNTRSGTVVVNITLVEPPQVSERLELICKVFEQGYAMGQMVTLLAPGEKCDSITVPRGMIGIGTVCSITLNGVLLKCGVPANSRFGGLLELHNRSPQRFVEIITYEGTTIDPLEVFIRSGMTDYVGAVTTGSGRIGASFREFPSQSRDLVQEMAARLEEIGLGGFMDIGRNSQPVLDVPVSEGRVGAIVIGGLNPVAILEETGVRVYSRALAGLMDFGRLFHFSELPRRLRSVM